MQSIKRWTWQAWSRLITGFLLLDAWADLPLGHIEYSEAIILVLIGVLCGPPIAQRKET